VSNYCHVTLPTILPALNRVLSTSNIADFSLIVAQLLPKVTQWHPPISVQSSITSVLVTAINAPGEEQGESMLYAPKTKSLRLPLKQGFVLVAHISDLLQSCGCNTLPIESQASDTPQVISGYAIGVASSQQTRKENKARNMRIKLAQQYKPDQQRKPRYN
jgi:hypothetical protein